MQDDETLPATGSDLEGAEIASDQVETKSVSKKPQSVTKDQNPDHV